MITFTLSDVVTALQKVVTDLDLGVAYSGQYHIHESLVERYLDQTLDGISRVLYDALGVEVDPPLLCSETEPTESVDTERGHPTDWPPGSTP